MKSRITLTLLLLLLPVMYFMGGGLLAQTYQINTPTPYQPVSIIQGGVPDTYKVDVVNNSTTALASGTFTVTLPAGMEYVAGTITGGTQANISNLQKPVFTLVSIPSGNIQAVTFQARINCGYTQASTISYALASGATSLATGTSAVASNTPAPAFVLTAVPNPQVLSTQLKTDGTRTIKFKNSGVLPVTTVYVEGNVTTAAQIPSYKISSADNGTISAIANGQRVTLTGTALQNAITTTVGGANTSFDPGEEITIVIHEQITNCATGSSIPLTIRVGSGDTKESLCFVDTSTASITAAVGNPSISLTRLTGTTYPDFCTNGKVSYTVKSEGTGAASSLYNIKFPWSVNYANAALAPIVEPEAILIKKISINGNDITSLVLKRNGNGVLISGLPNCWVIDLANLTSAYGTSLQNLDNDGKYDDLLAGQSFQLDFEYGFNTSAYQTCTLNSLPLSNTSSNYFALGTSFSDQCGARTNKANYPSGVLSSYSAPTFQVGSQQFNSFSASLSKAALYPGDKITLSTSFSAAMVGAMQQAGKILKTFTIILPDGLDYDDTQPIRYMYNPTGTIFPVSAISYNVATRTLVLTPASNFAGINTGNDLLQIPLIVNGTGTITNKTIQYSSTFGFTGCGVVMPYACNSQILNYSIVNGSCATVGTTAFDMTRATFGYIPAPSNTNVWYMPTGYVNENTPGINLHGAVAKDKVKTMIKGVVNSTSFTELWARVKYTSQVTSNLTLSNFDKGSADTNYVLGTVTVTKASDGSTLSTNITVGDLVFSYDSATTLQLQQVNLSAKIGVGKAINYALQVGDQIEVNWMTKVTRDNLSYTFSPLANLEGDLYTKDAVGTPSNCQAIPVGFSIQRLSISTNNNSNIQAIVGTNSLRVMASVLNGAAASDVTGDHFPNEVRTYGNLRSVKATIPGIWILDTAVGKEPYYATSTNVVAYKFDPALLSITYSGGNTIVTFNNDAFGSNGMPSPTANLPVVADWTGQLGNTGFGFFMLPVCATAGPITTVINHNFDLYTTAPDGSNTESVPATYNYGNSATTYYNYKANAAPTLQNVDGISSTVNWQVKVTNTSDTAAIVAAGGEAELPNNWMSFVSPNNNITVTKLVDISNGTEYPVISYGAGKYWVKLGKIATDATFNVVATYTACSDDKLQYTYSFGATGYPIDPDQGYDASVTTCAASQSQFDLNLKPKDVSVSMTVTSPANPVQFCTNETSGENKIDFTVNVANTGSGNAENLVFEAAFPAGYAARTGTSEFTYNGSTKTLKDPTYNNATGLWEWNITTDPNGTPFLPGAAAGANSFILKYQGETNCSYVSGSSVNYTMKSSSGCGKVIEYKAAGTAMELSMKPSTLNSYYLAPKVVALKNDGTSTGYQIEVTNQGTQPLSPGESIYVTIPKAIDYVAGSIVHVAGAANVGEPLANTIVGNNRVLHFPLPTGADNVTLAQNETAKFSISLKIIDAKPLSCGVTENAIILDAIYAVPGVTCGASPCDVSVVTGNVKSNLDVTKTAFAITPVSGIAKYASATNNTVTIKYNVQNTGTIVNNTPIIVDFFNDLNGDGVYNVGETILYTQTISGAAANLTAGGTTPEQTTAAFSAPESGICKIAAIIRTANNAQICTDVSHAIPVDFEVNTVAFSNCAGTNTTIGNLLPTGATISWSPATYLSDTTLATPVFNYNGTVLTVPTNFVYTGTITHPGGCTDSYTATVTVNPLPIATISYPSAAYCNRGTAAVTLTGTAGGTYSGDTGLVINATTGLIDLAASTTGNHDVTYTFSDGSCQNKTTTIIRINPTTLPGALSNFTAQCSATVAAPTLTDPCAGTITGTTSTVFPITTQGTTVVTWTFNYGGGFTRTATQNVILTDITAPVVPVLADIIEQCSSTPAAPTTTDNCAGTITGTTTTVFPITTQGTTIVEWTFADGNGNSSKAYQNVIITDTTAPIVPVLADVFAQCEATPTAPTTTDNCAGTITGTTSTVFPITSQGTTTVTWTFEDGHGNSSTAVQKVIITDTTAPVVPVLDDVIAQCSATPEPPSTTDACTGTVIGTTSTVFPITAQGTTVVTWTFTDGNGNSSTATQNVIITDTQAPVAPVLTDVTAQCTVASITPPVAVDACKGNITGTTSTVFPITTQGTTVVTWSFADGNGNTSTATQNVIITDTQAPVAPVLMDVTAQCTVTSITAPVAVDACKGNITGTTSTVFPITTQGTTVVTWSFADGNGNTSTATQNVIITDTTAPVAPVLTDVTAQCTVTSITPPVAVDACAGNITGTTSTVFPITAQGTTVVTWSFADGNGNTSTATQNVIITDTQAPVAPVLTDVTAQCTVTSITPPVAVDACKGNITGTTSTVFPITTQGTTVVTWSFADGNGNTSTATQNVIITDTQAPVAPVLTNVIEQCSATLTAPVAVDACTGNITGTTSTVFPITTQGTTVVTWSFADGNGNTSTATQNVIITDTTAPVAPVLTDVSEQCSATLTAPVAVDACAGNITGTTSTVFPITTQGTTVVTWSFADGNGNTSTATQNVIIRDTTAPVVPVLADVTGQCSATPTAPTTTDNCAGTITGTTSTVFPITAQGTTVVTWTFADGNGNSVTANQNVIIDSTIPPVAPVLADVIEQCSATLTAPTTTDNCGGITITGTTSTVFPITTQGTTVVTWTFDDGLGNISTATQNVIITDTQAPVAPVLTDVTAQCTVTSITAPVAVDACKGNITGTTSTVFPITTQGTTVITWSFADGNGNTSTATQNVIITDTTAPVAPVLTDVIEQCSATLTAPVAVDACAGNITGTTSTVFPISTQGTTVVTWSFADGNGNTSTATQNVIITDTQAPIAPVLADVTGQCSVTLPVPTATDNCAGTVTGTTSTVFPVTAVGTTKVTWTFNDGNGNSVTADQNIIIENVALNGTESTQCAADGTGYVLSFSVTGQAPYTVTGTGAPGTWNGNNWTSDKILAGVNYNVSVQDAYACNTVIVTDIAPICCVYEVTPPTFPAATVECYSQIPTATTLTETEFEALGNGDGNIGDIPCGVIQITAANSNDPGCNGNVIRTYTVTEYADPNNNKVRDNGEDTVLNTTIVTQTFTIQKADFVMPANGAVTVACSAEVVTPVVPVVKDNCGNVLTAAAPVISTMPACNGVVTYTYTFTDCAGHTHDWVYTYTINNTEAPKGTAPAAITVQCIEDVPAASINAVTNVTGNCNNNVTVTVSDTNNGGSGCNSNPYIVTRTYTLTDCGGLTTTLTQTITVKDTTAPVFVEALPGNLTVECSDVIPAAVTLTAVDNCSSATVTYIEVKVNGSCSGNYKLNRTWTAVDVCGNQTSHTQVITVVDTTAPVFVETLPPATVEAACDTIPEVVTLTATDACGTATVTFNETKVDGDCSGRYQLIRTWTASDECNNETSFTQTINVGCLAEIYNGLSPNGDGINDTFVIGGIDCFTNNSVKIFNRYGAIVYEKDGYDNVTNPFEGVSQGKGTVKKGDKLPTGTYFYTLEYDNNGKRVQKSGYLYISNQ